MDRFRRLIINYYIVITPWRARIKTNPEARKIKMLVLSDNAKLIGSLISIPLIALDQIEQTHINNIGKNRNNNFGSL